LLEFNQSENDYRRATTAPPQWDSKSLGENAPVLKIDFPCCFYKIRKA